MKDLRLPVALRISNKVTNPAPAPRFLLESSSCDWMKVSFYLAAIGVEVDS